MQVSRCSLLAGARSPPMARAHGATAAEAPEVGQVDEAEPAIYTTKCRVCDGSGGIELFSPEGGCAYACSACVKGVVTVEAEKLTLAKALDILDPGALRRVLRQPQDQEALAAAVTSCLTPDQLELLLDAGVDAQIGFERYVKYMLSGSGGFVTWAARMNETDLGRPGSGPVHDFARVDFFGVFVKHGATANDEVMAACTQALKDAERYETGEGVGLVKNYCVPWKRQAGLLKKQMDAISELFEKARPKVLNLSVKKVSPDSWSVSVHSLGGDGVLTLTDLSPSLTLGELQEKISSQASIPWRRQCLVLGSEKLDVQTAREKPLREALL